MSLILIEGFDSVWPGTIEVASRLNRLHPVNDVGGGWKLASGRDGGYSIYCATASTTATMWLYPPGREKNDTWIVGCNVYIRDVRASTSLFCWHCQKCRIEIWVRLHNYRCRQY